MTQVVVRQGTAWGFSGSKRSELGYLDGYP